VSSGTGLCVDGGHDLVGDIGRYAVTNNAREIGAATVPSGIDKQDEPADRRAHGNRRQRDEPLLLAGYLGSLPLDHFGGRILVRLPDREEVPNVPHGSS
jgi:hypothetical protein